MPTLVATPGASNANSFATVGEADAYFAERNFATGWTGLTDTDVKERYLIMATRRLDQVRYLGTPTDAPIDADVTGSKQALSWPRLGVATRDGWTVDETIIPSGVKRATHELALVFVNGGADPFTDTGLEGFESLSLGPISLTPRHEHLAGALPEHVYREIEEFVDPIGSERGGSFRMVRVR